VKDFILVTKYTYNDFTGTNSSIKLENMTSDDYLYYIDMAVFNGLTDSLQGTEASILSRHLNQPRD